MNGTKSYAYDDRPGPPLLQKRDRLVGEVQTGGTAYSYSHAYDASDNPTTLRGVARNPYNADNQRTDAGFVYDNNGNPTTYKGRAVGYDPGNRMTSYTTPNCQLTAGYTAEGLRSWKDSVGIVGGGMAGGGRSLLPPVGMPPPESPWLGWRLGD